MSRMLTDMADVLRRAGLRVTEDNGWKTRARGSGGYAAGQPSGIVMHHDAGPATQPPQNSVNFAARGSSVAPVYNAMCDRTGLWWVIAAGATNNAGAGGPHGSIPVDGANARMIGLCGMNNGVGETWPTAQYDAFIRGAAALAAAYAIPLANIITHAEWAPTRKIDPAGPNAPRSGPNQIWQGAAMRSAISAHMNPTTPPPAAGGPISQGQAYDTLTLFYATRFPDQVGAVAPSVGQGNPVTTQQALFDTLTLWHAANPTLATIITRP